MNSAGLRPVAEPHGPRKRAIWDLAIGVAGLAYLGVVLFVGYYSPIFGAVWIVLAGYEVLEPRFRGRSRSSGRPPERTGTDLSYGIPIGGVLRRSETQT
jgi:hypothetical protein